ncbi:hypothetical protein ACFO4O_04340 [Glaciecola siphonariae]|uniref:Uncharacterized protein n=1 Tax=Glaciecola siphonariae TaxID=521012 RepID=A0ABV9LSF3_9ALTE
MSSIEEILNAACNDVLQHLGVFVFINGKRYSAVIEDDEFEDEAGYRRFIALSFSREDAKYVQENDTIVFDDNHYVVRRKPPHNAIDPFVRVELKRA